MRAVVSIMLLLLTASMPCSGSDDPPQPSLLQRKGRKVHEPLVVPTPPGGQPVAYESISEFHNAFLSMPRDEQMQILERLLVNNPYFQGQTLHSLDQRLTELEVSVFGESKGEERSYEKRVLSALNELLMSLDPADLKWLKWLGNGQDLVRSQRNLVRKESNSAESNFQDDWESDCSEGKEKGKTKSLIAGHSFNWNVWKAFMDQAEEAERAHEIGLCIDLLRQAEEEAKRPGGGNSLAVVRTRLRETIERTPEFRERAQRQLASRFGNLLKQADSDVMAGRFDDAKNKYHELRHFPIPNIDLLVDDHMTDVFIDAQQPLKALEELEPRMTIEHGDIRSCDEMQSVSAIVLYQNVAKCYSEAKQHSRAAVLFREVERAAIRLGVGAQTRLPSIYSDMALNLKRAGQLPQAQQAYKMAMKNLDKLSVEGQRTILINYALLLRDMGQTAEAKHLEKRAQR